MTLTGEGSQSDPYEISNADELAEIDNIESGYYVLVDDINLENLSKTDMPIFIKKSAVLDGQGYTIKNIELNTEASLDSLFDNWGVIKDINVEGVEADPNYHESAALIGHNIGKIINCSVRNCNISSEGNKVGGMVVKNKGEIIDCVVESSLINGRKVGGICATNKWKIQNCQVLDTRVWGSEHVGGIAGANINRGVSENCIQNCRSEVLLRGNNVIGGLVGRGKNGEILDSVADIQLILDKTVGSGHIGSLVGKNYSRLENCYSTGEFKVEFTDDKVVGLIAGWNDGRVYNCFTLEKMENPGIGKFGENIGKTDRVDTKSNSQEIRESILIGKI